MMSHLAEHHPRRAGTGRASRATAASSSRRASSLVEVPQSPSIFFAGMAGSRMPDRRCRTAKAAPTSSQRGERRRCIARCASSTTAARPTEAYPFNPNGSPDGLTGVTTADGRFTIMMPHPERVFRSVQMSWHPRAVGRGFAVAGHVPQRPQVAGLTRDTRWSRSSMRTSAGIDDDAFKSLTRGLTRRRRRQAGGRARPCRRTLRRTHAGHRRIVLRTPWAWRCWRRR